jgi:hypothetical protein
MPCSRCGSEIELGRGEGHFVEIRAVADPTAPVLSEEDLAVDTERAIAELVARIHGMSEQQLVDQVYRRSLFWLCSDCHGRWMADPFGAP